jgi:hypothetical protein
MTYLMRIYHPMYSIFNAYKTAIPFLPNSTPTPSALLVSALVLFYMNPMLLFAYNVTMKHLVSLSVPTP